MYIVTSDTISTVSSSAAMPKKTINLDSFHIIKCIGKGIYMSYRIVYCILYIVVYYVIMYSYTYILPLISL